ncbi:DUF6906 family protein [Ureibacillus sp. FSL K6-2830]|uniref:DUF6906 family protein n=1 Tax=Ureibacillus sp. FSL K6-2830 TaxID=2954610 RepID=UPI0030FA77F7
MKRGRKLTVNESKYIKTFRLNPNNWLISKKMSDQWLLINRYTNRTRIIPAP